MKTLAPTIAAFVLLVLHGSFAAAHADTGTGGHCTGMTVTDYFTSNAMDSTSSTTWQNVTDARRNITTSATGCVVIAFSAPAFVVLNPGEYEGLHVRTLLDGKDVCVPVPFNDMLLAASYPSPQVSASITRTCKNVAAGNHIVQVQYVSGGGLPVLLNSHVLTVTHN